MFKNIIKIVVVCIFLSKGYNICAQKDNYLSDSVIVKEYDNKIIFKDKNDSSVFSTAKEDFSINQKQLEKYSHKVVMKADSMERMIKYLQDFRKRYYIVKESYEKDGTFYILFVK